MNDENGNRFTYLYFNITKKQDMQKTEEVKIDTNLYSR